MHVDKKVRSHVLTMAAAYTTGALGPVKNILAHEEQIIINKNCYCKAAMQGFNQSAAC